MVSPGANKLGGYETVSMQLLKQNKYKRVELHVSATQQSFVRKKYSGHPDTDLRMGAWRDYQALVFLSKEFRDIVRTPEPLGWSGETFEVTMEYLPHLASADTLSFRTISAGRRFFERCYEIKHDFGFLENMRNSVLASPTIVKLIDAGFPLSLGFKGDLRENLGVLEEGLILADVETICLEPMGLTELVIYGQCFASPNILRTAVALVEGVRPPVAWTNMNNLQAIDITLAAIELLKTTMGQLPEIKRNLKLQMARWGFSYMLKSRERFLDK